MSPTAPKEIVPLRLPRQICDEVRSIASREGESQSTIFRRLLRRGLETEHERRALDPGGDAV